MTRVFFFVFILLSSPILFSQTKEERHIDDLRTIVTLLDYVSKDYEMAVQDGKIIDDAEYMEQIDFVEKSSSLHDELIPILNNEKFNAVGADIKTLLQSIQALSSSDAISLTALKAKNALLDLGLLKISPIKWPSIKNGKELYEQNCASCHGVNGDGDGPQGEGLDPEPTSFMDGDDMLVLSPLQAYNVIKLGVEGTGMASYDNILTEYQIWDLAFYVKSMLYEEENNNVALPSQLSLDSITKWSDNDLRNFIQASSLDINIGSIRAHEPERPHPLDISIDELNKSYELFKEGDIKMSGSHALKSYLEGIELVENMLPRERVATLERDMIKYRKAIKDGNDEEVEFYFNRLHDEIGSAKEYLTGIDYSFAFIYLSSLSILLREALEALLIILIVISVLKPLKAKKAITAVHIGWIVAVALGVVSWVFVDKLVNLSGASRELMEGIGSIVAVVVLLYAGTWLHSYSEVSKWTTFIKEKVNKVSDSGNWMALSAFSFIVVFREAFEVVIFLSSLNINSTESSSSALFWALITSIVLISIMTYVFLKTTKKLPIGKIFKISALIIALLAIVLTGKGIHGLQEAGMIGINILDFIPRIEVLGIYPTAQTVLAQIIVLSIIVFFNLRNKKQSIVEKS